MDNMTKMGDIEIGASIARSALCYSSNEFKNCIFKCEDKEVLDKYFPNKREITQDDIQKVYYGLQICAESPLFQVWDG